MNITPPPSNNQSIGGQHVGHSYEARDRWQYCRPPAPKRSFMNDLRLRRQVVRVSSTSVQHPYTNFPVQYSRTIRPRATAPQTCKAVSGGCMRDGGGRGDIGRKDEGRAAGDAIKRVNNYNDKNM